ncbi:TetR/AcrR family transcriptional regulator [Pseudonocardia sp. TRM90224]|uniref:TetR/AcrR family transcriptional regulator n=1 Tax=Pseudonocardia sp. TRM90224 TaxID=2812678 RepID=UPI001E2E11B1|nr:TetR/AcrR family transcriptional regulator [Pseudonocardia sp. TRM90224]
MPRTKEFDPDTALQSALELFWQRGYESTSMADLVEHLGVARASIYATFGGKRELYLKALDRYREIVDPGLVTAMSQPGPALPAVRALVERFAAEAAGTSGSRGCFITNTAVELAPHDPDAARRVQASWQLLETALTSALIRAGAQGELAEPFDAAATARMLVVFLQGVRVAGKAAGSDTLVRDATRQALALLR